ncbi:Phage minor capsid protein 2 [uncultured Mediterranean phage uvMED]|nr:Phage minor capsid protein 2 [uncultured Mediterranean phage uvMED]BAQ91672.1 Phage minor capsid protein 2 [uncultured Mediterranean phage uvMED]BAQ91753.1 Phage minor capsid protein 2 [uncultured Mediterranean phage uvMED]BAQ91800.1 Phage minor capsid protein 2 [uncultured Mediterranean phage uvMED]BAR20474.1 Phage minor capsid protein 2 [uncultured Mediterranean phage uvMED]
MSRILEKLADQHEERIINVLYKLENDVVNEITRATKGNLVSQRLAIQLQPRLRTIIESTFLNEADLIINDDYNKIAKETLDTFGKMPIPAKFKNLTDVDLATINALKTQSFSGFEDIAERFLKVINDEVYQSTIAGRPFNDMVSNIKSHINGVYKASNVTEIKELVDYINENKFDSTKKGAVEDAIRRLHTKYASDRAGNNLRRYASQIAHDSVMQFHGQFTVAKAKASGLNHFTYTGTLVRDSREFCVNMLNKTLTEEQIRDMWNTRSWQGKSTGDPFIVRGGYRCRHTWIPTDPAWGEETVDEVPDEPVVEEAPPPIKKGRKSTLDNPVREDEINIVSNSIIADRLQKQITKNAKDSRYDVDSRFRTSNVGKVTGVEKLDDEIASQLNSIIQELDELAELYNVPKLRSVTVTAKKRALMAMGDGNLYINPKYFNRKNVDTNTERNFRNALLGEGLYNKESRVAENYIFNIKNKSKEFTSRLKKERKTKPDTWERPHNAFYFFKEEMDKFRNVAYHEFGHQVHQMKNKTIGLWDFAPIEDALRQKLKSINGGATRYSNANTKEWFAENFSLYHMGREELVDPKFIEFLENEVLK